MLEGKVVFEGKTAKGMPVLIRYPKWDDLHAMLKFINTLSAERTYILIQGEEISLEDETRYLENFLSQIAVGQRVQLAVFADDTMVGNADVTMYGGVQRHVGGLGIAIADGYRGSGIGGLLMDLLIKEAIANLSGLQMIILEVFSNNPIAMHLYRKMGFAEYGRLANGIIHREQLVDAVLMVKMLRTTIDTFESTTTA